MILWTIVPLDSVFQKSVEASNYEEIYYQNIHCIAEKNADTQYKIVRILSTNPMDYLHPKLQPGTLLNSRILT